MPSLGEALIGVRKPVPKSIEQFGDGVTLDSSSGGMVRGFSSCADSPDSGVRELRDELTAAMEDGYKLTHLGRPTNSP